MSVRPAFPDVQVARTTAVSGTAGAHPRGRTSGRGPLRAPRRHRRSGRAAQPVTLFVTATALDELPAPARDLRCGLYPPL